jgi:hypothetical protein
MSLDHSRSGLGDIPPPGKAGAPSAAARSRRARAREEVCEPKDRPFQQRVIAVCRALPCCDPTPKHRGQHEVAPVGIYPYGLGRPAMCSAGWSPVGGGKSWTLEMAGHLISKGPLEVISNRSAGNGRSPGKLPLSDLQGHFHGHDGRPGLLDAVDASLGDRANLKRGARRSLSFGNVQSLIDPSRLTLGRFLVLVPIDQDLRSQLAD